jgi:transposase
MSKPPLGAVSELAAQLAELGIEKVTIESTSDYWRVWYYLLEADGLDMQLVNARDVKNVSGRFHVCPCQRTRHRAIRL